MSIHSRVRFRRALLDVRLVDHRAGQERAPALVAFEEYLLKGEAELARLAAARSRLAIVP